MSERPRWLTGSARSAGSAVRDPEPGPTTPTRRSPASRLASWRRRSRVTGLRASRARFERRAAAARRRPWLLASVAAGVVLALVFAVWLVGYSAVLATRTVTVTGLSDPAEQEAAAAAAAVPLGTPLARVDVGGATERVARIPTVASVSVSRSWPSTVVVSVQRKVPVLAVKNPQGQLEVVDASGVTYERVDAVPAGVAQVNATGEAPDPDGLRAAISVLQILPAEQRATVTSVTVSSADLVTFTLGSTSVVWGGVNDGPKKLVVLKALLPTKPAVVDVSAPDTPVTR